MSGSGGEPKPIEVLTHGIPEGEKLNGPESVTKAYKHTQELRKYFKDDQEGSGKKVFEKAKETASEKRALGQDEVQELTSKFGLGETKERDDGTVEEPESADAKRAFTEASKQLVKLNNAILYSEIQSEAERMGKKPEDLLKEKGVSSITWSDFRNSVLDSFIANESLTVFMGDELKQFASIAEKRDFIDSTLAQDPVLRGKLASKLHEIKEKIDEIPEMKRDEEMAKAEKDKKELDQRVKEGLERIKQEFEAIGEALDDETVKVVQDSLKSGRSAETVLTQIKERLITQARFPLDEIQDLLNLPQQIGESERQVMQANVRQTDPTRLERINTKIDQLTERLEGLRDKYRDPEQMRKLQEYQRIMNLVTQQKDEAGTYFSPVLRELQEVVKTQRGLTEAENKIKERQESNEKLQKSSRKSRERKEWELINRMENALGTSVVERLEERYDEMVSLSEAKKTKEGEQAITDSEKKVKEDLDVRYIENDETTRTRIVNRDNIGEDMRLIAYEGEDGIKRIILRALDFRNEKGRRINWSTVDIDSLSDEQKSILDNAYAKMGEQIQQKLMTSYFIAKSPGILRRAGRDVLGRYDYRGSISDLRLRPHEWELLEQNFSGKVEAALKSSNEAQGILKKLESHGVQTKFKLRYLIYILLSLGIFGVVRGLKE